ncbi:BED zinc finger family protein [Brugia malayi]|uniref:BED zinc finger family protein n=1 Tax=Brugia malayi TaxID=6279 RepID=A0A4E9F0Y2_BRUMA|nr:BED zinc finger family protein [Brugia malayi]VIO89830.1 BED zinc finger family protein [Brugia malayi]
MDEGPSSSSSENPNATVAVCSDEIAPAILSTSGTWLRLSMPYFPKKSVVWRYFDLYESDGYSRADTERIVKCRLMSCMRKELRLDAQSSTKGMWEHLRNKHPDEALKCENGAVAPQEEPNNGGSMESAIATNQQVFAASSRLMSDVYAPYSSLADEKKYEIIHRLIGKLLESMQECQDRVHISEQYSLLSFADYARLLAKAKTTTQFVCREAPLMLPEPGTIVIYDSKDSGELDLDMLQMREHLRQDGYSFDNSDSGLLPDNLYITRFFSGCGDDFEDGRIMRYEVTTTYEDAGYVLFHYVKGTKYEVGSRRNTGEIPVHCYKPKAPRLKRVDENKRRGADASSNRGSPISHQSVKIKRNELDGLQAIAGCLPPSFQLFLGNIKMETDKDENLNGMDLSFEENVETIGSGVDDSQIEDNCVNITGLLTSSYPNRDLRQTLSAHDVKTDTKVEKRVMNILKKAVRDQRRSKVHYLARRTKNVNWVKVADELQKKAVMITAATNNVGTGMTGNLIANEFEEEEEEGHNINDDDGDDDDDDVDNDNDNADGSDEKNVSDERMNNIASNYDDSSSCDIQLSNTRDSNDV